MQREIINRFPARFLRNGASTSGVAAIEFSLIVPILMLAAIATYDVADITISASDMETAVRASTQYAMNGGSNMSTAQTLGVQAWNAKPSGGTLTVSTSCTCGSSGGTCGSLCPDGSIPQTWVTATAQGLVGANWLQFTKTVTEKVQTR